MLTILKKYRLASGLRLKLLKKSSGFFVVVHQAAMMFGGYKQYTPDDAGLDAAKEFYDSIVQQDRGQRAARLALETPLAN